MSPNNSELIFTIATSSASPELSVMHFWVVLHVFTQCLPSIIAPPDVLLDVCLHPAQPESVYHPISPLSVCHWYWNTVLGFAFTYLASLLSILHCLLLGVAMPLHISLVAYWMSGLSIAK